MSDADESRYQYLTYTHITTTAGIVVGIVIALTFFGFALHDYNESEIKMQPERTKQLQESQKLQAQCLASTCPVGQYRVFKVYDEHSSFQRKECYCDVRLLK